MKSFSGAIQRHPIRFGMVLRIIAVALTVVTILQIYLASETIHQYHGHVEGGFPFPPKTRLIRPQETTTNERRNFVQRPFASKMMQQSNEKSALNGTATLSISQKIFNVDLQQDSRDRDNSAVRLLHSKTELKFIHQRQSQFETWFNASRMNSTMKQLLQPHYNADLEFLQYDADRDGPWLDFVIAGFPKCGTTTLMATLGQLAPMPIKDVCELPPKLLSMVYQEWPLQYGGFTINGTTSSLLLLRGNKCPAFIGNMGGAMMKIFSNSLKRTKFIIGIRHPVLWFQSFWRMQGGKDPYQRQMTCPCRPNQWGLRVCRNTTKQVEFCWNECGGNNILCLARTRFHVALAQMGKTALTKEERQWLAPKDFDGGDRIISLEIPNDIFIYELTKLQDGTMWEELAAFLRVSKIPKQNYHGAKGKHLSYLNICDAKYDDFRAMIMPYSYELSVWLLEYLLPVARDPTRNDVTVANIDSVAAIFETYKVDPCGRLVLQIDDSREQMGDAVRQEVKFMLDPALNIPPL
ncbi:hypothetical protein IV203_007908 [Nitzschia inconspicua]|uniref:Sulfotransferase n=1 Tax=Nitzschia inconspicua TaxID=303405 RepID=A0A9K3KXL4_9STRA|nr:hypothetical protein IV203_007908 [Nitzschia inconspicua]